MPIKNRPLTINFLLWDPDNNQGAANEASNITLQYVKDGAAPAVLTNSVSEPSATGLPGIYEVALTAGEMDGEFITVGGIATGNLRIMPQFFVTEQAHLTLASGDINTIDSNLALASGEIVTQINANETKIDNSINYIGTVSGNIDTANNTIDTVSGNINSLNNLSAAQVNAEVDTALADYDGPTRAELTSDIGTVTTAISQTSGLLETEINANETKIDSVTNYVGTVSGNINTYTGTDSKVLISTDAQDLSATLDVNTKTLTNDAITAAKIATDAIGADELADNALQEIAGKVAQSGNVEGWNTATSVTTVTVSGYTPGALSDMAGEVAVSGNAEGWNTAVSVTTVTVSGYTQTGLDLLSGQVAGSLNNYDPPTRTELTSDTNSVLTAITQTSGLLETEINANETKIDNSINYITTVSGNIDSLNNPTVAEIANEVVVSGNAENWNSTASVTTVTVSGYTGDALIDVSGQVNGALVNKLDTATYAEPGAGLPSNSPTLSYMTNQLYRKIVKDKVTATSSEEKVFMNNGSSTRYKRTLSDDGTTTTKGASAAP